MTDVSKNSGTKDEGKPTGPVADGHGLSAWFDQRPKWLQDAARRILQNGKVTADDLMELVVLCKKEVGMVLTGQSDLVPELVLDEAFAKADPAASLRLEAIGDIRGVNALAPRKALVFGSDPLTVVYGSNGSGKSGYMRILKHVCGARSAGALHGNIFDAEPQPKSCTISYVLDGTAKKIGWTPSIGVHSELRTIAIYDTDCAHVYVNDENEVAYEPPMLNLFRLLVDVCEDVDRLIADENHYEGVVETAAACGVLGHGFRDLV